jgi:hypothetical protein
MSETPAPAEQGTTTEGGSTSRGLLYAIYGAMMADLGCIIGAIGFLVLIILSAEFYAVLTPCTSAGGIPCAP